VKTNTKLANKRWLLAGILCGGLILANPLSAAEGRINPRFVELRIFSPVNQQDFGTHIQQLVRGSILKTYLIEYQYPTTFIRVVGIDIKTADNETYSIHLAPPSIFIKQGIRLEEGNDVIVRGPIMNIDQHPVLIASMVSHRGQSIQLRTDKGVPRWDVGTQLGRSSISKLEN
jgi:hypothetical protein